MVGGPGEFNLILSGTATAECRCTFAVKNSAIDILRLKELTSGAAPDERLPYSQPDFLP
jgi:hypothetical protein